MKVTLVRINKTEKGKLSGFIKEVNNEEDTVAILKEGYYEDSLTIASVGSIAMGYILRKVECTFDDYSITVIK